MSKRYYYNLYFIPKTAHNIVFRIPYRRRRSSLYNYYFILIRLLLSLYIILYVPGTIMQRVTKRFYDFYYYYYVFEIISQQYGEDGYSRALVAGFRERDYCGGGTTGRSTGTSGVRQRRLTAEEHTQPRVARSSAAAVDAAAAAACAATRETRACMCVCNSPGDSRVRRRSYHARVPPRR